MRSLTALRDRDSPATNAPTMGASFAASASSAKPSVNASAKATTVPADRALPCSHWNSAGPAREPTSVLTIRKRIATPMIEITSRIDTVPSETTRTTTVRMTSPSTSSATAAPSTVRASTLASARRSLNTRAVMPTLVAASAAPRNNAVLSPSPMALITRKPETMGTATPTSATEMDARPTAASSPRSISMPTWSNSRITPSSPSTASVSLLRTRSNADGPITTPARISATTAGKPIRSAISAAIFAATRTIRMSRRTSVTSIEGYGSIGWSGM